MLGADWGYSKAAIGGVVLGPLMFIVKQGIAPVPPASQLTLLIMLCAAGVLATCALALLHRLIGHALLAREERRRMIFVDGQRSRAEAGTDLWWRSAPRPRSRLGSDSLLSN